MGLSAEEIAQPLVGVASCWNEAAPCNIALMRQAQAVKRGVAAANGTARDALGDALPRVTRRDVAQFVTEHRCQLGIVLHHLKESGVHPHLA
jgi:hypothetical protein